MLLTGLHRRLSDFIHSVVVHRRDGCYSWSGGIGLGLGGSFNGASLSKVAPVLIWFPLLHFSRISLISRLVVLECLQTLARIDERIPKGLASLLLSFWAKGDQP